MFQMYGCDPPKTPKPLIRLPHKPDKGKGKHNIKPAEDLQEVLCLDSVRSESESIASESTTPVDAIALWRTQGDMERHPGTSLSPSTVPPAPSSPLFRASLISEDPPLISPVSIYSPIDDRPPTYQSSRYDIGVDEMPSFPDYCQPPSPPLASPVSPRSLSSKKSSRLQYHHPRGSHDPIRLDSPPSHPPQQPQHLTQGGLTLPESQPSHTPRSRSLSSLYGQCPPFLPTPPQRNQHPLYQPLSPHKPRPLPLPPGPPQPHLFHEKLAHWDRKERESREVNVSPRSPLSPRTPTTPSSTTASLCVICDDYEADIVVVECGYVA